MGFLGFAKFLSNFSGLPAVIIGRRQRSLLWLYACVSFSCDMLSFGFKYFWGYSQSYVTNVFLTFEFLVVTEYFIQQTIPERLRHFIRLCGGLVAGLFVARTILFFPATCNFGDASVLYALLFVFASRGLYIVVLLIERIELRHSELFLFSSAMFVYTSGTMLLLIFDEQIYEQFPEKVVGRIWAIHDIVNAMKNIVIAWLVYLSTKRPLIAIPK